MGNGNEFGQEMGGNGNHYNTRNMIFNGKREKQENAGTIQLIQEALFSTRNGKKHKNYKDGKDMIQ